VPPSSAAAEWTALREGFITGAGAFLPARRSGNDRMEEHLGRIQGRASLFGKKALRWNGVESRHYAMAAGRLGLAHQCRHVRAGG
jgi:3-oxoacyl-[acyl-carrier-protein] synthase III